jgi:hypothetical protein
MALPERLPEALHRRFLTDADFHAEVELTRRNALRLGYGVSTEAVILTLAARSNEETASPESVSPSDREAAIEVAAVVLQRTSYAGSMERWRSRAAQAIDAYEAALSRPASSGTGAGQADLTPAEAKAVYDVLRGTDYGDLSASDVTREAYRSGEAKLAALAAARSSEGPPDD